MRTETDDWLSAEQRGAARSALARAYLRPDGAPSGYAETRARLWVALAAARTLPDQEAFTWDIGRLTSALTKALSGELPDDKRAELEAALLAVGQAWRASGPAVEWGE